MSQCDLCWAPVPWPGGAWVPTAASPAPASPHLQQRCLQLVKQDAKGPPKSLGGLFVDFVTPPKGCGFPPPRAGGAAQDPLGWHSTFNGIEEAAASPGRDLGGLRFQMGFGAGA